MPVSNIVKKSADLVVVDVRLDHVVPEPALEVLDGVEEEAPLARARLVEQAERGLLLDHLQRADDRLVGRRVAAGIDASEDVGGEALELVRDEPAEGRLDPEGQADREGLAGVRDRRVLDPERIQRVQEVVERGAGDLPECGRSFSLAGGHGVARRLEVEALPAALVGS